MIQGTFTLAPCTDKYWRAAHQHQLGVNGYDGGGWIDVAVPLSENDLDELIVFLQAYRRLNPRPAQKMLASDRKKPKNPKR